MALPPPRKQIQYGDTGYKVRELKNGLARLGHLSYELINDKFDFNTKESVKLFQDDEGLQPTGIVDDETWKALSKALFAKESQPSKDGNNVKL